MSSVDRSRHDTQSAQESEELGFSLARSVYRTPLAILLHGELGTGKTTFTKGFAKGLGITETVTSPTYAIEQRYGDTLLHMDLFRIDPADAQMLLDASHDFPGIRVIEWPARASDRASEQLQAFIDITCEEHGEHTRSYSVAFHDIPLPTMEQIDAWIREVHLPTHIVAHMRMVEDIAMRITDALAVRHRIVRREALRRAALLHDLLRFVDFPQEEIAREATGTWASLADAYGTPHEKAASRFLAERGFPELGAIIEPHGMGIVDADGDARIEQRILSYADKRVLHDTMVSIDERFADFRDRYAEGRETEEQRRWHAVIRGIEHDLFPDGVPF